MTKQSFCWLAFALCATLAGCDKSDAPITPGAPEKVILAFVTGDTSDFWTIGKEIIVPALAINEDKVEEYSATLE